MISCSINVKPNVVGVVDGDTIRMSDDSRIRIFGIDTPESFDKKKNFAHTIGIRGHYAMLAKKNLKNWLNNNYVTMEYIKLDPYQRKVSKVYANGKDVAILLLKNGLARVHYISIKKNNLFYTKDVSYYNMLMTIEKKAKKLKVGIWSAPSIKQIFP